MRDKISFIAADTVDGKEVIGELDWDFNEPWTADEVQGTLDYNAKHNPRKLFLDIGVRSSSVTSLSVDV